jgi:hypothetical protein
MVSADIFFPNFGFIYCRISTAVGLSAQNGKDESLVTTDQQHNTEPHFESADQSTPLFNS